MKTADGKTVPFYQTPYTLLRVPEYSRHFDSKIEGGLYRILVSRIYRQGLTTLDYYNPFGVMSELSRRYTCGILSAFYKLTDLENITQYSIVSIREALSRLKAAGLVRVEKFGEGFLFELGERILWTDDTGKPSGKPTDELFIDSWYKRAYSTGSLEDNLKVFEFRKFIVKHFAPPSQCEEMTSKIDQERDFFVKQKENSSLPQKNFTPNFRRRKISEIMSLEEPFSAPENPSIEDKEEVEVIVSKESPEDKTLQDCLSKIGNSKSVEQALKVVNDGRRHVKNTANRKRISTALLSQTTLLGVPQLFPETPLFNTAIFLARKSPTKEKIAAAIYHMTSEFLGINFAQHGEMYGRLKRTIETCGERYTLDQVAWTVAYLAKYDTEAAKRVAGSPLEISKMVDKFTPKWQAWNQKKATEATEAARKQAALSRLEKTHTPQEETATIEELESMRARGFNV